MRGVRYRLGQGPVATQLDQLSWNPIKRSVHTPVDAPPLLSLKLGIGSEAYARAFFNCFSQKRFVVSVSYRYRYNFKVNQAALKQQR